MSSAAGEELASEARLFGGGGRVGWFASCCDHRGLELVGLVWHGVESQHNPGYFIDPGFGGGSF